MQAIWEGMDNELGVWAFAAALLAVGVALLLLARRLVRAAAVPREWIQPKQESGATVAR